MDFWRNLFDTSDFPARWNCGRWTEGHGWLHILSDIGIWGAYFAIPCLLAYFVFERKDLPFRRVFLLFVGFILFCGTTHFMEAVIFWWPAYRLAGVIKFLTATISWATVFALVQVAPRALAMRSPEELEREIVARKKAEQELQRANEELEQRVRDRTAELEAANEALQGEREWFSTTLASIGDAVITTDTKSRITLLNPVAESLTGWSQTEAQGQRLSEVFRIVHEVSREPVENPALRALKEGAVVGLANHTTLLSKGGGELSIDDSAAPIRDNQKQITGAVLIFRDITQRKNVQRDRDEALARTESVLNNVHEGIITIDESGMIESFNPAAERLFGYQADEIIGQNVRCLMPEPYQSEHDGYIANYLRTGEAKIIGIGREVEGLRKDGSRFPLGLTVSGFTLSGRRYFTGIVRDITERKLAEEKLRQIAAELSEANRRKDNFLATLSHELRNPLAPISTGLEVLKAVRDDPAQQEEIRQVMERQTQQLVTLVDDLMDVSRITRGKFQLRTCRVAVQGVIQSAVESVRPMIDEADHTLSIQVPQHPLELEADPHRLAQVFSNLLSNAAKYTPTGGRIDLHVESQGTEVVVTVKDTGIGITPEQMDEIFEMFGQIEHPLQKQVSGLGIGLTLVKSLVEMHKGSIEVHSEGPNQGSEFTVRLPLRMGRLSEQTHDTPPAEAKTSTGKNRVLVVDDNTAAAKMLSMAIKILGYEVRTAGDGQEAIAVAAEFLPDTVLMDIGMPRLNGYEAAEQIRQQPWGQTMRLIALTGWGQEEDKRRSKEAGFDHHLVKPAEPAELRRLLAESNS